MNLYMMIGPPGSGKTTYRKHKLSKLPCISPDDFIIGKWTPDKAAMAWVYARRMAAELIKEGIDFVVDAQFINGGTRRDWTKFAREAGYSVHGLAFDTPWQQIMKNNKARGNRGGYGSIPADVLLNAHKRMCDLITNIGQLNGFDSLKIVSWAKPNSGWRRYAVQRSG